MRFRFPIVSCLMSCNCARHRIKDFLRQTQNYFKLHYLSWKSRFKKKTNKFEIIFNTLVKSFGKLTEHKEALVHKDLVPAASIKINSR